MDLIRFFHALHPHFLRRVNNFGCNVVHWAASSGRVDVLRWLVEEEENKSTSITFPSPGDGGETRAHEQVVEEASSSSVSPTTSLFAQLNDAGHGAIVKASWKGHRTALEYLLVSSDLDLRWQISHKDKAGLTPIDLARMAGHMDISLWLQSLLEKKSSTSTHTLLEGKM
ncbi:unnamed protein product [Amoebophrya sp. A25]|nr:unnamed protein product [Amoebophrya sp. A25]|eukprot:GSA25T00026603001.1